MNSARIDGLTLGLFAASLTLILHAWYQVFYVVPTERTMGVVQRIFYIHVPSAFIAFLAFFVVFVASLLYLTTGKRRWDSVAVSAAEVGLLSCAVVLLTGPLWAKKAWGIWWAWDARLTLTLVLFLIYVGYLMLRFYVPDAERRGRLSAVFSILGIVNVYFTYMANRWWRTQHPAPVIAGGEDSGLDPRMWTALLWSLAAILSWSAFLFVQRYRLERAEAEFEALDRRWGV